MKRQYSDITVKPDDSAGQMRKCSEEFLEMTGFKKQELAEKFQNDFYQMMSHEDAAVVGEFFRTFKEPLQLCPYILKLVCAQGEIPAFIQVYKREDAENIVIRIYHADFLEDYYKTEKNGELFLREHAERDILTGIYNRYTTELYADRMLSVEAKAENVVLFLIGLDEFKAINDTYGHIRGDQLLRKAAECLKDFAGEHTILGRIGGDEFALFQSGCGTVQEIEVTAEKLCTVIRELEESEGIVTASVGIALSENSGQTFADLYYCADDALYQAKHAGKGKWAIYSSMSRGKLKENERMPVSREWLLEESSDIVYVCDFYNYSLLYMNQGARTKFGIKNEEYVGRKCYEVLQHKEKPCEFCTNHLLCKEKFYNWEFRNEILGQTLLLRDRIVDWYGTPARIEFATDVSLIDQKNQILEEQIKMDKVIISCLRILNSGKELDKAVREMLELVGQFYKAERAYILDYHAPEGNLTLRYEWAREGAREIREIIGTEGVKPDEHLMDCLRNRRNYLQDNISITEKEERSYKYLLYDAGVYCQRGVPIYMGGKPMGMIGVDNPGAFWEEMAVLETLSYFVSEELARNKLSESLSFLGYHDSLTGLWNRNRYVEYLDELRKRKVRSLGVAVADINALKDINKYRGHIEGDEVVKRAALLLNESFSDAVIFRLSGDEFIVHCENIQKDDFHEQVKTVRRNAIYLQAYGISIGHAWTDKELDYSRMTMQATDIMMIQKREFYQYHSTKGDSDTYDLSQQKQLMEQIRLGNFKMYLQPKADCQKVKLNGAEALVRFSSAEHGIIAPDRFVPWLEKEHMIQFVDLYIFEEVCRLLSRWIKEERVIFPISLNFSRQTVLDPDLLDTLFEITARYNVPKEYIEVEITESFGDYESLTIAEIGEGIKAAGFQLALDDFGSHYTNMAMLANVPVDVLKLDKSMVQGVMSNISNQLVLKSVLNLCKELGIYSIAEGVETEEQLDMLRNLQCDSIQGYLFGKPMPVDVFEKEYM